ncbi:hypothetical protein CK203_058779 [Vitis vinifera]|uniref:Uncharacterized protein n=1 Tax=Vitis vinifera TaxID=29760 RepID=A0A438FTK2_VITVI|nr:hypothetical protein CK203_058779 [Vitis vinifera]
MVVSDLHFTFFLSVLMHGAPLHGELAGKMGFEAEKKMGFDGLGKALLDLIDLKFQKRPTQYLKPTCNHHDGLCYLTSICLGIRNRLHLPILLISLLFVLLSSALP